MGLGLEFNKKLKKNLISQLFIAHLPLKETVTANWNDSLLIKSTKFKCQMKIDEVRKKTL